MGIEEEIRQGRFASEFEKAAINVMFTGSWLHGINASRLKKHDITPEQYNVLRILRGSHPSPLRLADITCRMLDRNSNATRLVEKLKQKGLAKRAICETNRRQVDISLTDKGHQVLKAIDAEEATWTARLKTISRNEAQELSRILDKLRS